VVTPGSHVRSIRNGALVAELPAQTLRRDHQWDRQERHEHHQLETVDEGDRFRLRGPCLREHGVSAQGDDIELVSVVARHLPVGRDVLDERRLRLRDCVPTDNSSIGFDQGEGLVTRDAKLRLGIGQCDSIWLGIKIEERIVFPDWGVRFGGDGNDLSRDLRADRGIHCLNVNIFLRNIATGGWIND
jgi:hypothetical protein